MWPQIINPAFKTENFRILVFPDTDFPQDSSAQVSPSAKYGLRELSLTELWWESVSKYFKIVILFLKKRTHVTSLFNTWNVIHSSHYFHRGQKTFLNQMTLIYIFYVKIMTGKKKILIPNSGNNAHDNCKKRKCYCQESTIRKETTMK